MCSDEDMLQRMTPLLRSRIMEEYENIYETYIKRILARVKILRIKTLCDCVNNQFAKNYEDQIFTAMLALQRKGVLLLSSDGWCMTKGAYKRFTVQTQDFFNDAIDYTQDYRLSDTSFIKSSGYDMDVADCMVITADMEPDSDNFVAGYAPWFVQFVTKPREGSASRIYQITKVRSGEELTAAILLSHMPWISDEDLLNCIYRIAVIEDPDSAFLIPRLGFVHIVQIDDNEEKGYRLLESRPKETRWSDYRIIADGGRAV